MSNNKYNNTSDIMDYLENELDNAKRAAFEQQMKEDPELSMEVEAHKKLREELSEETALYDIVNKAYEKHKAEPVVKKQEPSKRGIVKKLIPLGAIAAAATILLFFLPSMFKTTLDDVNVTHASADIYEAPSNRSTDGENRRNAYEAYNTNKAEGYKKALPYFEGIQVKNQKDRLLMGISYAKTQQYDEALNLLTPLSQKIDEYPNEATRAQWEIIGVYLAQGDTDKALAQTQTYMNEVPESQQEKAAKKLLRQLRKLKK